MAARGGECRSNAHAHWLRGELPAAAFEREARHSLRVAFVERLSEVLAPGALTVAQLQANRSDRDRTVTFRHEYLDVLLGAFMACSPLPREGLQTGSLAQQRQAEVQKPCSGCHDRSDQRCDLGGVRASDQRTHRHGRSPQSALPGRTRRAGAHAVAPSRGDFRLIARNRSAMSFGAD